jgi:hypothetical protein
MLKSSSERRKVFCKNWSRRMTTRKKPSASNGRRSGWGHWSWTSVEHQVPPGQFSIPLECGWSRRPHSGFMLTLNSGVGLLMWLQNYWIQEIVISLSICLMDDTYIWFLWLIDHNMLEQVSVLGCRKPPKHWYISSARLYYNNTRTF